MVSENESGSGKQSVALVLNQTETRIWSDWNEETKKIQLVNQDTKYQIFL